MKRKSINLLIILVLLVSSILLITCSNQVTKSILDAITLWLNTLVPNLLPFFLLVEFLNSYGVTDIIAKISQKFMMCVFHVSGNGCFVFMAAMLSGFPSGAKYIKDLLDSGKIDIDEANYLYRFAHFVNPLFVLGVVATLLQNMQVSYFILISHYLATYLLAFICRPSLKKAIVVSKNDTFSNIIDSKRQSTTFIKTLNYGIQKALMTLTSMLGIIIFFFILTTLLTSVLPLSKTSSTLISGILEMSQGILKVSNLTFTPVIKASIITFLISFSGFSIILQSLSVISDTSISFKKFIPTRIKIGIISVFLFNIFYYLVGAFF